MTEVATGNKGYSSPNSIDCSCQTGAKAEVIFVRQKTVAQRHYLPAPTVLDQEIKWHSRTVVKSPLRNGQHLVILGSCFCCYCRQELAIKRHRKLNLRCAEVGKVTFELRPFVRDKGTSLQRRVR